MACLKDLCKQLLLVKYASDVLCSCPPSVEITFTSDTFLSPSVCPSKPQPTIPPHATAAAHNSLSQPPEEPDTLKALPTPVYQILKYHHSNP